MREEDGFTSAVRLELASLPVPSEREARAELAGMLLAVIEPDAARDVAGLAGLRPGDLPLTPLCAGEGLRLDVPSSAVARRGLQLVQRALGVRPRLSAISTGARRPHGPAYRVALPLDVVRGREAGRGPRPATRATDEDHDVETAALLRGWSSSPARCPRPIVPSTSSSPASRTGWLRCSSRRSSRSSRARARSTIRVGTASS